MVVVKHPTVEVDNVRLFLEILQLNQVVQGL